MKIFTLPLLLIIAPVIVGCQSQPETMTVRIYFGNIRLNPNVDPCNRVFPVTRTVPRTGRVATAALEQLFAGPTRSEAAQGYISSFSERTRSALIRVRVRDGAAYVNLRDIREAANGANTSCGSAQFFAEVDSTLKQFPTIREVFFAFEGDPAAFYDWMQIGECPRELGNCDRTLFQ